MSIKDEMGGKEHFRKAVWQTPFHPRISALNTLNEWHRWKDYTTADAFFDEQLEYAAIRNACAVFDLTPMTKHLISGPDALAFLNRLVTRDIAKLKAGRVGYCVWCDDNGQVIDDGTIFHLREGVYRLCSQERQLDWLTRSAFGFDVTIVEDTHDVAGLALQGRRAAPC
jgi:aminomethyltransferase